MNYFIDEELLQIEEKNIFTATELITLIPVCGDDTLYQFFRANDWATNYYPNYSLKKERFLNKCKPFFLKNFIEKILNNTIGERLDNFLFNLTTKRWQKKEASQRLNIKGNRMGLRTGKHFSKPNPVFFQQKILKRYSEKLHAVDSRLYTEW